MADQIIALENGNIKVEISTHGAEMQSIVSKNGTSFLWNGDPAVWKGRAPVIFPICGGLKDDKYVLSGKEYTMPKHGFAKLVDYTVEENTGKKAVLLYTPDDDHKAMFPFDFEFRVIFALSCRTVSVTYDVVSKDKKTMYFSLGGHEGYSCPEGIEEYSVVFDKKETLDSYILDGNLLEHNTVRLMENAKELPLKYDYFKVDATVFKHLNSSKVTLTHKNSTKRVTVEFPEHDFFLLWTKVGAKYICLEPWCGVQDPVDSDYDITKKEGIISLDAGGHYFATHKITVKD